ncbi:DUF6493 family protein, partial [Streptomyces sp. TRM 70361]
MSTLARLLRTRERTGRLLPVEQGILDTAGRKLTPEAYAVLLAVADGEIRRLPELLTGLSEAQRRSCVPHLKAWRAGLRDEWGQETQLRSRALVIAGAGCHTGAAAAARWLGHDDLSLLDPADAVPLLTILAERPAQWLNDVAHRVAGRLRSADEWGNHYLLAERLVLLSGGPVPTGEPFVRGWARARSWPYQALRWPAVMAGALAPPPAPDVAPDSSPGGTRPGPLVERLRADPFLDTLLPRLFETDDVGAALAGRIGLNSWPPALAELAAEGRLDRAALIDDCLSRLLRGGRPGELRVFHTFLKELDPTDEEYAARATVLLRLLRDGTSPVAGSAQERLAALDAAGLVDPEHLFEASRTVLLRPEKKLVRAQLKWLDTAARRDRERAGAVVLAAADALGHEDTGLQERALNLIARHLPHAGEAVSGELAAAAEAVSPVLRPRAAELLGLETAGSGDAAVPAGVADVLPPVAGPRPMAPPLATAVEVAEEVGAALAAVWAAEYRPASASAVDAAAFERALDGLVRHGYRDRAELVRALAPVVRAHPWSGHHAWWNDPGPWELRYVAAVLGGEGEPAMPSGDGARAAGHPHGRNLTPFGEVLGSRIL